MSEAARHIRDGPAARTAGRGTMLGRLVAGARGRADPRHPAALRRHELRLALFPDLGEHAGDDDGLRGRRHRRRRHDDPAHLGGIDLSVGSVVAFAMVLAGWLFLAGIDPWVASGLAILASAGIGAAMGFCVTRIGLHHFIVSLAFMVIARGACLLFTAARPLGLFTLPPEFKFIGQGSIGVIPFVIIIFVVFVVVFDFLLRRSTAFRKVFYTGSNEKAAAYSGIRTKRVIFFTTVLCSTLARRRRHHLHGALRLGAADLRHRHGAQRHRRGGDRRGEPLGRPGHHPRRDSRRGAAVGGLELARPARRLGLLAGHHPRLDPARRRVVRPLPSPAQGAVRASMRISNDFQRYEAARQIYSVLVMHFQEGITQAEIAKLTKLSHAKVNRLIKQGREMGMVEITIRSPYQALFDLEAPFHGRRPASRQCGSRRRASANPRHDPPAGRRGRGEAAARDAAGRRHDLHYRRQGRERRRRDAEPGAGFDVEVVPATGCVQGKHYTDVNHVATQMADKLGGQRLPDPRAAVCRQRRRERTC